MRKIIAELEARRAKAKKALNRPKTGDGNAKKSEIEAALARVRAKKQQRQEKPRNTDNLTPEQKSRIKEVDARRTGKPGSTQQDH